MGLGRFVRKVLGRAAAPAAPAASTRVMPRALLVPPPPPPAIAERPRRGFLDLSFPAGAAAVDGDGRIVMKARSGPS